MKSTDKILEAFSNRLKELLASKSWSIKDFSTEINIPRTTINSWILKKKVPRSDYLCIIADYFNITTDFLLGREE